MHCEVIRCLDVQLELFQGELWSFPQLFRGVTAEKTAAGDSFGPVLPQLAVNSLRKRVVPAGRLKEYEQSRTHNVG
jgi:hypothetical protein